MIKWLLIATIIALTTACGPGCLKCSANNSCLFCDTNKNYVLSGQGCQVSTQLNCALLSQSGGCVQCLNNYYLSVDLQRCIAVPSALLVPNCLSYSTSRQCTLCAQRNYLSGNQCLAVNKTIPNCQTYNSNVTCSQCSNGFIFTSDYSACQAIPSVRNCLLFTYIQCDSCLSSAFANQNAYFDSLTNQSFLNSLYLAQFGNVNQDWTGVSTCRPITVSNCSTLTAFNTCLVCQTGFYLSNGNCAPNPLPSISNCAVYSSLTVCSSCSTGFHLVQAVCVPNTVIEGCLLYDGAYQVTRCLQCSSQYFLSGLNCRNRTLSLKVNNCANVSLASDTCANCTSGFQVTSDGLSCLPSIANCAVYASTNVNSVAQSCSVCADRHYLNSSAANAVCVTGTIQNCRVYSTYSNVCQLCSFQNYLTNNFCVGHSNIDNCVSYSQTVANQCLVCSNGFFPFLVNTVCKQTTPISNCLAYNTQGTVCLSCAPGYYVSNQVCSAIPVSAQNCLSYSGNTCTNCTANYQLTSSGSCVAPFDYLTTNCASIGLPSSANALWSSNQSSQLQCLSCSLKAYPFTPGNNEAVCVANSQLNLFANFQLTQNCKRFGLNFANQQSIVCMECTTGYYVSGYLPAAQNTVSTTCVASCQTVSGLAVIADDLFGFVQICVPIGSQAGQLNFPNCQTIVRVTTSNGGTAADFNCISTTLNAYLTFTQPASGIVFEANNANYLSTTTSVSDYFHGFELYESSPTPTVFNQRGFQLTITTSPVLLSGVSLSSCDIVWTVGSGNVKGSMYQSVGGQSGAFTQVTGSQVGCLRCASSFRVAFTVSSTTNNLAIPNCVPMYQSCLLTAKFGGLPSYLNSITSCHSCAAVSQTPYFPIIYMEINAVSSAANGGGNLLQFSLPIVSGNAPFITANNGFNCRAAPLPITVSSQSPSSNTQTVTNCAVFGVLSAIVTSATDPLSSNINNYCLACSTGYYPVYFGSPGSGVSSGPSFAPPFIVTQCIQSNKCSSSPTSTPFNSCGQCSIAEQADNPPAYYAYTDHRLINCIQSISANCFIVGAITNATGTNRCSVCQSGYFLNLDFVCDKLHVPNAASNAVFSIAFYSRFYTSYVGSKAVTGFDQLAVRLHYLLGFGGYQYGVSGCFNGYLIGPVSPWQPTFCAVSSYLQNTNTLPANSNFVTNCQNYKFSNYQQVMICAACSNSLIPTSDGRSCVALIANCQTAQSAPNQIYCAVCSNGFYNAFGKCVGPSIANCAVYVNTQSSFVVSSLLCQTCNNGFYLTADGLTCSQGLVSNCAVYATGSATSCTTCLPSFVLLRLASQGTYCYQIPSAFNCSSIADPSFSTDFSATISCTACSNSATSSFGLSSQTAIRSICAPLTSVNNCLYYDQSNPSVSMNTYECQQCIPGFFYSRSLRNCVQRVYQPILCSNYSNSSDTCIGCQSGSFLNANGTDCVLFPKGIFNCATYSSPLNCTACLPGNYLSGNACLSSTLIPNCQTYSANYTCSACSIGYFLQNSTLCVTAQAQNCATYVSINACGSCYSGYGLVTLGTLTSCQLIVVSNCAVPTTTFPFTCSVCASGFYADSTGTCRVVTTLIPNCQTYDSNVTCSGCATGTILSVSKSACTQSSLTDPNCKFSSLTGSPRCAVCQLGSYFSSGSCVQCNQTFSGIGCLACDPTNISKCLFCSSGYYQNSSGHCVSITNSQNSTKDNQTTYSTSKASLLILSQIVFIIVLF